MIAKVEIYNDGNSWCARGVGFSMFSQGQTYENLLANLKEATEFYFEAHYANGIKMIVSNKERSGVTWEGTEGWVWANRGKHEASSKGLFDSKIGPDEINGTIPMRILVRGSCARVRRSGNAAAAATAALATRRCRRFGDRTPLNAKLP